MRGNLHTHTVFSDGKDTIEDYCREALRLGFSYLGFSDHAPIERKTGRRTLWHMKESRLDEYLDAIAGAKEQYKGRLAIYAGLEVDFVEGFMGPSDEDFQDLIRAGRLDYIIGSVHYVRPSLPDSGTAKLPGEDMIAVDAAPEKLKAGIETLFKGDKEALLEAYWQAERAMCIQGGLDIVGHMDLVKKNKLKLGLFDEKGEAYRRGWHKAAEAVIREAKKRPPERPLIVEVNTGGWNRGAISETYPSGEILALLREAGIPLIPGSDAHRKEELAGHFAGMAGLFEEMTSLFAEAIKIASKP
jgi:histidinol-phosphatase (PHP family)